MSNAEDATEPAAKKADAAPEAEQAAKVEAETKAAAKPKAKPTLFLRHLEGIKRQKSDHKVSGGAIPLQSLSQAKATPVAEATKAASNANSVAAAGGRARGTVRAKSAKDMVVRRLGLPLKGEKGSSAPAAGSGLWKRSFMQATAARVGAAARRQLAVARPAKPRVMVPPVVRVKQESLRAIPAARRVTATDMGRKLAAALGAANARPARPLAAKRVRPIARLGGVAAALLTVKEEEVEKPRRRLAPKVITVLRSAGAARAQAPKARARHSLRPASGSGFGYGHGSGESDESPQDAAQNGRIKKSRQRLAARKPVRGRQDIRSTILGTMQRHLASAKQQLSAETGGIKVKEEERWEPADAASEDLSADDDEEASQSPPRKRAKHAQDSDSEEKRQDLAVREAKEMKALQGRLESHYSSMKNFIRTKAEPTIFYLPAKHNKESKRELEETRTAISQKISSLKAHLHSMPADEDDEQDEDEES